MLREDVGVRYTTDNMRGLAVPPAVNVPQYWSSAQFGEWLTNSLPTRWKSGLDIIELLKIEFDASEVEPAGFDAFGTYGLDTYTMSVYADDLVFEKADLEAEAAKFSRDILKAKLENIIGVLEDGDVCHFLDDTIRIVKRVQAKPEWVQGIETLGTKQPTTQELVGLIRTLKSLMGEGDFWQIDTAFRTLNVSRVSIEGLIALLRTTNYRRSSLETWTAFLDSVRKEVIKRGLKPEDVLFGLT